MPIKGENGGYKYKAFFNGEWHDLTLSDSLNELTEWLQSNEEWTRVKYGHWTSSQGLAEVGEVQCSNCKTVYYVGDLYDVGETDENGMGQALMPNYCPHCGAKMDEVEDGKTD